MLGSREISEFRDVSCVLLVWDVLVNLILRTCLGSEMPEIGLINLDNLPQSLFPLCSLNWMLVDNQC